MLLRRVPQFTRKPVTPVTFRPPCKSAGVPPVCPSQRRTCTRTASRPAQPPRCPSETCPKQQMPPSQGYTLVPLGLTLPARAGPRPPVRIHGRHQLPQCLYQVVQSVASLLLHGGVADRRGALAASRGSADGAESGGGSSAAAGGGGSHGRTAGSRQRQQRHRRLGSRSRSRGSRRGSQRGKELGC